MPLEIRQLRQFAEVAAAGSISRAAKQLNIVQSALSRRIQQLELMVGVELFQRRASGVALTPAGRRLLRRARNLLGDYDRLCYEFSLGEGRRPDRIRLGITSTAAQTLLPGLASLIQKQMPDILFQVVEGASERLRAWVMAGELDLAIITNPPANRALHVTRLWREALFLVTPGRLGGPDRPTIADVQHLPFILTSRTPGVRQIFEAAFRQAGYRLNVTMEMESIAAVKRLIAAGNAFSILPYPAIQQEMAEGVLAATPLANAYFTRGLVRRAAAPLSPSKRRLIALVIAEVERRLRRLDWAEILPAGERRHKPAAV